MKFTKVSRKQSLIFLITILIVSLFVVSANAQDRERVVTEKQQVTQPTSTNNEEIIRRPGLTNKITIVQNPRERSLVKKTSSSRPTRAVNNKTSERRYLSTTIQSMMFRSIQSKIGIRYRMGTQGPNRYDCSGFIWKVFQESGMSFTRTSAREFWRTFEPVHGDDRFQFGTLVFFNRLGHVGIVADRNGFYHASSSRGITYSKFAGYWSKRIVGYRQVPVSDYTWDDGFIEREDN